MSAPSPHDEPRLLPAVRALLAVLRRRVRQYVWAEGLAVAVAWLGFAFWASLVIDWFFEPTRLVRGAMLAAAVCGLLAILWRWIGRRAFVPFSDGNMAMLLERRFPELDDALLTAVQLTERRRSDGFSDYLLAETCRRAAERAANLQVGKVFNPAPLRRGLAAAVLLALSVALFAGTAPGAMNTWQRRVLLFSEELWPRQTRLLVDGFDEGVVRIARGTDLSVVVRADTRWPHVPEVVHVRYRTEGGARGTEAMVREGDALRSGADYQDYTYTFQGVLAPIRFDLVGGDARIRDLAIEVVPSPTIVEMTLACRFPAYTAREPRELPVAGPMAVPRGTRLVVHATTNKELVRVQVDHNLDGATPSGYPPADAAVFPEHPRHFQFALDALEEDQTLFFTLVDTDGIRSREPVRLSLQAVEDEAPRVAVRLAGIGSAVTPQARIPVAGTVSDDFGIARVFFGVGVEGLPPRERTIVASAGNPTELAIDDALEIRDLTLTPGQRLELAVKATDRCAVGEGPNTGSSERWVLDVVTADQLLAILQSRELTLRQRFETVIGDVASTRSSLAQIDLATAVEEETAALDVTPDVAARPVGAEPGDAVVPASGETAAATARLRVARAQQNSRKDTHETLGIAEAFEDICLQLENNRLDTYELNQRLRERIAHPLRHIADEMFPELERRLVQLAETLEDGELAAENHRRCLVQSDQILLQMRLVLGQMLELEEFHEAVAMLRKIIDAQAELRGRTEEVHRQRLRELLLEDLP